VWLIDDAVEGMVSLGAVRPDEARVTVPDGLDLAAYPIVDVSREPLDGDPLHSGDSLWRGRLATPS
jgi:Anti-sigma-K factor rskA